MGPLSWATAPTAWTLDLPAVLVSVLALSWYARTARRVRAGAGRWPRPRSWAFGTGIAVLVIATCSVVGAYARTLLWVYTVQACLLLLVAPLLLGGGSPLALAAAGPPGRGRRGLDAVWGSRAARIARAPGVGPMLIILVTFVLFFAEPVTAWAVRSSVGYQLVHLALIGCGLVFALPLTDEGAQASSNAYAAMLGLGFVEFLLDAVPGIALRLLARPLPIATWLATRRVVGAVPWGPDALADQHLAGAWLWFFAEAGDLPFLVVLVLAWIRVDDREAVRIDAELAAAATVPGLPRRLPAPDELTRPWWESDPSVFGDARARRSGWTAANSPEEDGDTGPATE